MTRLLSTVIFVILCLQANLLCADRPIVIGSKIFTESYVLSELAAQTIESSSKFVIERKFGMGSTGILFESLKSGAIDVYPDYTGTLAETILKNPQLKSIDQIRAGLKPFGLTISSSLGFNNTYALAVKESFAQKYDLRTMSDLQKLTAKFRAAFSYEFMDRADGYLGMVNRYQFKFDPEKVIRMEHSLVYKAIDEGAVDVIEVYSTDANINKYQLRVLGDDRNYFPAYQAVWVTSTSFAGKHPGEWQRLQNLEGKINEGEMRSMNAAADIEKINFPEIASKFLDAKQLQGKTLSVSTRANLFDEIVQRTKEHLWLVGIALLFSFVIGLPLGIIAARLRVAGQIILLSSALVQTIPTLALLCFLIPVFGVGLKPALVALCLYSLLPVVLNTFTALRNVDEKHIENARAFGLSPMQILTRIELPLGSPVILAGLKTATIVSVGTATLAALIGAGGYGALIISGLSLNNISTILAGAIPAALMALLAHFLFAVLDRLVVPRGLRRHVRRPNV